jgi:hypothetical protein
LKKRVKFLRPPALVEFNMNATEGNLDSAHCHPEFFELPGFARRKIVASFPAGDVSNDVGILALRAADRFTGLCPAPDAVLKTREVCIRSLTARLICCLSVYMD